MAFQAFKSKRFSTEKRGLIDLINEIIEDYTSQGLTLTLRQLYYQLVSRDVIPNQEKSYKNLGSLVSEGRLAGLIDWDSIEDRVRKPVLWREHGSIQKCVEEALTYFRLPRWRQQPKYVELWVEKDAIANVLQPIASRWHIPLMVNRGYSSSSAMYEAAARFMASANQVESEHYDADDTFCDRPAVLLYLGDHDPSGEDMVRDIETRLTMFGVQDLTVEKLALTMEQVRQYKPPPNPAKLSDSRAAKYVKKYGKSSWEVDALPPPVLTQIITDAISSHTNLAAYERVRAEEKAATAKLRKAMQRL